MAHTFFLSAATQVSSDAVQSTALSSANGISDQSAFLINPWLDLIILGALVITGAVAVIREIEIEEQDSL